MFAPCFAYRYGLRLLRLRGGLMDAQRICTSIDCETMTYQAVVYFGQEARHRNICFGLRDHEKFKTVEVRVVCAASPSIMDQVTDRMNPYQPRLAPTGVGLPWNQPPKFGELYGKNRTEIDCVSLFFPCWLKCRMTKCKCSYIVALEEGGHLKS